MIAEEEASRAFSGRYRLLEFVGEGSNARVYVAEDLTLRRRVALKILRADTVDDADFLERFSDEMRATSVLHHPRVLPVYHWGLAPQPYTVTEYLAGGSLAAVLSAGHRLTPSQALIVGLEAARALVNIHRGGRAHLGLAPSSILFDSSARPYISDLGLAAALGATAQHPAELGDDRSARSEDSAAAVAGGAGTGLGDDRSVSSEDSAAAVAGGAGTGLGDDRSVSSEDSAAAVAGGAGTGLGDDRLARSEDSAAAVADGADADTVGPEPTGVDGGAGGTGVVAGGGEPTDTDASAPPEGSGEQRSTLASYSPSEQSQDIYDLALVLCESVTGARDLTVDVGGSDPIPITALGPLQAVLERATAADPVERLTAAELASELLRVATLLPRPDPLPLAIPKALPADAGTAPVSSTEAFEQIGPSVSERSAIPHDDAPRRRWPGLVLAAVLVLGGAVAGTWAWISSGSDATVPELQGRTRAAVAEVAAGSGWEVNEVLVRVPNTERGEVVGTEPAAGASLGEGATLDVFVSLGEPLIVISTLDGLYGMTVDDATDELEVAGLEVAGETLVNDDVVPAGNVMGLDVDDGVHELEIGSDVTLLVSDGPADRIVPAVPESREPRAAAGALEALQLVPRVVTEFSTDVPDGTVIGFRPASGRSVPIDSTVEVRVSRGPALPEPEELAEIEEDSQGLESEGEDSER